jgi:septum formation protein
MGVLMQALLPCDKDLFFRGMPVNAYFTAATFTIRCRDATLPPPMRLILASASASRQALLRQAGLKFFAIPSAVDEPALKRDFAGPPAELAMALAAAKAGDVAAHYREDFVIGADQLLVCEGRRFDKPESPEDAASQLRHLSGRAHTLLTAMCVQKGGETVWSNLAEARLVMRALSPAFITDYVAAERDFICTSAGGYRLEGRGAQLFTAVEGDFFTVLGLNLLPLLAFLRGAGALAA